MITFFSYKGGANVCHLIYNNYCSVHCLEISTVVTTEGIVEDEFSIITVVLGWFTSVQGREDKGYKFSLRFYG